MLVWVGGFWCALSSNEVKAMGKKKPKPLQVFPEKFSPAPSPEEGTFRSASGGFCSPPARGPLLRLLFLKKPHAFRMAENRAWGDAAVPAGLGISWQSTRIRRFGTQTPIGGDTPHLRGARTGSSPCPSGAPSSPGAEPSPQKCKQKQTSCTSTASLPGIALENQSFFRVSKTSPRA